MELWRIAADIALFGTGFILLWGWFTNWTFWLPRFHRDKTKPKGKNKHGKGKITAVGFCSCGNSFYGYKHEVIEYSNGDVLHKPLTRLGSDHDAICECRNPHLAAVIKRHDEKPETE